jgi:hypothetical protein
MANVNVQKKKHAIWKDRAHVCCLCHQNDGNVVSIDGLVHDGTALSSRVFICGRCAQMCVTKKANLILTISPETLAEAVQKANQ